jgi:hypothetical protein
MGKIAIPKREGTDIVFFSVVYMKRVKPKNFQAQGMLLGAGGTKD